MKFLDSWRNGGTGLGSYTYKPRSAGEVALTVQGLSSSADTDVLLRVLNSSDVSVFSVTAAGNLAFSGTGTLTLNSTVTGNLTVNGNTVLGNASSDTITITGAVTMNNSLTAAGAVTFGTQSDASTFATFRQAVQVNDDLTVTGQTILSGPVIFGSSVVIPGVSSFADGTAAAPSITFTSDTDTGIYRAAANQLGFAIAGAVELTLDGTNLSPGANDGLALGVSGTAFADVFLASGAVINFSAGNITLTHSLNVLTLGGGSLAMSANSITGVGTSIAGTANTALTISVANQGANTNNGVGITLQADAGGSGTTGGTGGVATVAGGIAQGSGNNAGGHVDLKPGAATGTGQPGIIRFYDTAGTNRLSWSSQGANDSLFTADSGDVTYFGISAASSTFDFAVSRAASSANYLQVTGGATGVSPILSSQGETNVNIVLAPKGTGNVVPNGSDDSALGTSALMWSDLFLASGGVIDFNSDITLTHSTDLLTFGGGNLSLGTNSIVGIGSAVTGTALTALTVSTPNSTGTNAGTDITLKAGAASTSGAGGKVILWPGAAAGASAPGVVEVYSASSGTAVGQFTSSGAGIFSIQPTSGISNIEFSLASAGSTFVSFNVSTVTSAVNYIQVAGAVASSEPIISAQGSDTDVNITMTPKGAGVVNVSAGGLTVTAGTVIEAGTTTSSGAGAVAITGRIHEVTTTGTGNALTLANGTEGQRLTIIYVAEGAGTDTAVLTPTSMGNGTTVTFAVVGDLANAVFTNGKWYFWAQGAVIA